MSQVLLSGPPVGLGRPAPDESRRQRLGPVSGRYEGEMTAPTAGRQQLDLRIDVDPRYDNSPVTGRLSGDLFQLNRISLPGRPPDAWRVYQESWVVDRPDVDWSQADRVVITGTVRFYRSLHPPTTLRVEVPWGATAAAGPAQVQVLRDGAVVASFSCVKQSDCFRELGLEVDVCQSVNKPPLRPSYHTHARSDRPADLPARVLTIEEAYREAGVLVTISQSPLVVDDSGVTEWSAADLHHALEEHFTQYTKAWPRWDMWGLLATRFTQPLVGGIMFDTAAQFGGAGKPPERQGFAVFRGHEWFDELPAGEPATPAQAEAARQFLYTWVHEAGHAFNFLHSWDKNLPDALSWMNYDWKYDQRNGAGRFWANFAFRFDDEELAHLRHGDRPAVIMGGDPWASGGHIEAPPGAEYLEAPPGAMSAVEGDPPLQLEVTSRGYFEFMEPVSVELRLSNRLSDLPLHIDPRLHPDFGGVIFYIRRPDGRILEYSPIACKLATLPPEPERLLRPGGPGAPAPGPGARDRYVEEVFLSYGRYGFYFDQPGDYLVRALYQGLGDVLIPSNVHRLRVGFPPGREEDRRAQEFFTYEVGMSLYLDGSLSPHLERGMRQLEEVAVRYEGSMLGVKAALTCAASVARPFHRVDRPPPAPPAGPRPLHAALEAPGLEAVAPRRQAKVRVIPPDPDRALKWTQVALEGVRAQPGRESDPLYGRAVARHAESLRALGREDDARREVEATIRDLRGRGAPEAILEAMGAQAGAAGPEGTAETPAPSPAGGARRANGKTRKRPRRSSDS